jgi:hypothetical protein
LLNEAIVNHKRINIKYDYKMITKLKLSEDNIPELIHFIRGEKVMLDYDLAKLYSVETRALKQAVRRNIKRFPEDFMFQLTTEEWNEVITNCDNPGNLKFSPSRPFAFTEQGVAMLSSILNSERAIAVNIRIIRVFARMRSIFESHKEILRKLEVLEKKDFELDEKVSIIFEYLRQLEQSKLEETELRNRKRIGFRTSAEPD